MRGKKAGNVCAAVLGGLLLLLFSSGCESPDYGYNNLSTQVAAAKRGELSSISYNYSGTIFDAPSTHGMLVTYKSGNTQQVSKVMQGTVAQTLVAQGVPPDLLPDIEVRNGKHWNLNFTVWFSGIILSIPTLLFLLGYGLNLYGAKLNSYRKRLRGLRTLLVTALVTSAVLAFYLLPDPFEAGTISIGHVASAAKMGDIAIAHYRPNANYVAVNYRNGDIRYAWLESYSLPLPDYLATYGVAKAQMPPLDQNLPDLPELLLTHPLTVAGAALFALALAAIWSTQFKIAQSSK